MMIKLYRELKDWYVEMNLCPAINSDLIMFSFIKDGKCCHAHIADFETMEKDPELLETILISELHDFLHRYFGIE